MSDGRIERPSKKAVESFKKEIRLGRVQKILGLVENLQTNLEIQDEKKRKASFGDQISTKRDGFRRRKRNTLVS